MRLFELDHVGCYLDAIDHRVEKTKDGKEIRMVDLTLRVQPFTVELAQALDADVRALLFNLGDALPKDKIKSIQFALTVPRQAVSVRPIPEGDEGALLLSDVEVTGIRARTEKGLDGFALVFYLSVGPVSARELESFVSWHTVQRFVTFHPQAPALDFSGASEDTLASKGPRRVARQTSAVQ